MSLSGFLQKGVETVSFLFAYVRNEKQAVIFTIFATKEQTDDCVQRAALTKIYSSEI